MSRTQNLNTMRERYPLVSYTIQRMALGARRIIAAHPASVATIPFPQGLIDVDSPQDHELISL